MVYFITGFTMTIGKKILSNTSLKCFTVFPSHSDLYTHAETCPSVSVIGWSLAGSYTKDITHSEDNVLCGL